MVQSIVEFIVRQRLFLLLFSLFLTVAAGLGLPKTQVTSNFEIFFAEEDENLKAYHELQDLYTKSDNIYIVVTPRNGQVFSREAFEAIEAITEAAWQLPYSSRVDSLTNFQYTTAEGDDLVSRPLSEGFEQFTADDWAHIREVALAEPFLEKRFIREESDVTGINISFQLPEDNLSKAVEEAVAATRAFVAEMEETWPQVELRLTGKLMNNTAFREASIHDLTHLVPIAFILAMLAIAWYLYEATGSLMSTFLGSLATLSVIVFSVLATQGVAAWMGVPISPPTANAPTIILTLAIADSLHILVTFFQNMRNGLDRPEAMKESLKLNFQPVFLTSITTVVGFLSMNFSDSPPFRDLGNVVAVGVAFAWFFSITLLPALAVIFPLRVYKNNLEHVNIMEPVADWVLQHARPLFYGVMAFVLLSLVFLPQNRLNDVWAEYFDLSNPHRQASEYLREHLTTSNTLEFSLSSEAWGTVAHPEYLATLDRFVHWLNQHPNVLHAASLADVMKRLNKNMHGDDPDYYRLPDNEMEASQYLLLYEMSLPYGLDLTNLVTMDKTASRLVVVVKDSDSAALLRLQQEAQQWLREHAPSEMYYTGSSTDVMFAHMSYNNIRSMLWGTALAVVIISAILVFALRSLKYGLISLGLNLIPASVGFGLWGLFSGEVGIGLSVVTGMTMGIVVDYTVHLLSKYLRAKREMQLDTDQAIRYAFRTVGVALMVTTVVLVANFGVLAFSDFALNADMGLLTAVTIVVALAVDLLLLPPVLLYMNGKNQGNSHRPHQAGQ